MKKKLLAIITMTTILSLTLVGCSFGKDDNQSGQGKNDKEPFENEVTISDEEVNEDSEKVTYSSPEDVIDAFWQAYSDVDRDLFESCFADITNSDEAVESNYSNAKALKDSTIFHLDETEMTYVSDASEKAAEYNYSEDFDTATYNVNVYITQTIDGVDYDAVDKYNMYTVYYEDSWYLFCVENLGAEVIDTTEDATTEDATTEDVETNTNSDAVSVDGLSEIYADLDNRSFMLDGHIYTVGVSTVQDMIDNGVVFSNEADAGNNVQPNYESSAMKVELGKYNTLQISVGNFTDENHKLSELPICQVYLPVDIEDEGNDRIQFAFPLNVTEDELVANSGEPTDFREYVSDDGSYVSHTYDYEVDSEMYIGSSGYSFEFANGELKYLYITYK